MDTCDWHIIVTYHSDIVGCFIWDLLETSWRRSDGRSLLRPLEMSSRHSDKKSWRCITETSWQRSFHWRAHSCRDKWLVNITEVVHFNMTVNSYAVEFDLTPNSLLRSSTVMLWWRFVTKIAFDWWLCSSCCCFCFWCCCCWVWYCSFCCCYCCCFPSCCYCSCSFCSCCCYLWF